MRITNSRIKNVTVGLDDRDRLSARMTFEGQRGSCEWIFILANPKDVERLVNLMNYARVNEVEELDGKIVRIVDCDGLFRGFGDPIEDKFIPVFGEELKEVTEAQFEEMLKTK